MAESAELSAALDRWQHWSPAPPQRPQLVALLAGGRVNQTYRVGCGSYRAVVRLNHPGSAALGIDRASERAVIAALNGKPYVASCYYSDATTLVSEFIEGRQWQQQDWQSASQLRRLSAIVADYAAVGVSGVISGAVRRYHYQAYCQAYIEQLPASEQGGWLPMLATAAAVDAELASRPLELVHHDLSAANVVDTDNGLVVLDWEYAGLSSGAIDAIALQPATADDPWQRQLRGLTEQLCALWEALA